MDRTRAERPPEAGDLVVITPHHVGEHERVGEILEVLGSPGHEHFRVRWEDAPESVFYPGSDAIVHRHDAKERKHVGHESQA